MADLFDLGRLPPCGGVLVLSAVPVMPMVMVMPAHLGGRLPAILNRRSGGRAGQRQRLGALDRSGQHQQGADGGKPQNFRHVHVILPWIIGHHAIALRPIGVTASPRCRL